MVAQRLRTALRPFRGQPPHSSQNNPAKIALPVPFRKMILPRQSSSFPVNSYVGQGLSIVGGNSSSPFVVSLENHSGRPFDGIRANGGRDSTKIIERPCTRPLSERARGESGSCVGCGSFGFLCCQGQGRVSNPPLREKGVNFDFSCYFLSFPVIL